MSAPSEDWDAAAEAQRSQLQPELRDALLAHLTKHDHLYDGGVLRVGSDLKPVGETCDRATYYRLKKFSADPPQVARRLRYERGRAAQRIFAEALRGAGREVVEEVSVRALRPTAWAWGDGHGDVLDVGAKHLYEVKAPGIDAWRRARGMPQKLVREAYRWQLSFYFHELRRLGRVETASWFFVDFEGEHDPVELPLTDDLIVPVAQIAAVEEEKNRLMWATEPPPRPASQVVVTKVLKGGRKTKKNPHPERRVEAVERRYWGCSFCDFHGTCQPGPEETPVALALDDPRRVEAVAAAEREWAAEDAEKARAKTDAASHDQDMDAPPPSVVAPPPNPPMAVPEPPGGGASASLRQVNGVADGPAVAVYVQVTDSGRSVPCSCGFAERKRDDHAEGCPSASWTGPSASDRRAAAADLAESMREIDERAARGEGVVRTQELDSGGW